MAKTLFIKSGNALPYVTDAYNNFQSLWLGLKLTLPFKFLFYFPQFFSCLGFMEHPCGGKSFRKNPLDVNFFKRKYR